MNILGIETSTAVCSVGIVTGNGKTLERSQSESHIHSEKLQVLISELLEDARVRLQDLDAVAVSIGPGSFTGLRIGLSSAKGLCYSIGKPILTVPTFEAIAAAAVTNFPDYTEYVVLLDAKQSDFYVAVFRNRNGLVEIEIEVNIMSSSHLPIASGSLIITDSSEQLKKLYGSKNELKDVHQFCRGDVVAEIGKKKLLAKESDELASVEPLYLKDFIVKSGFVNTLA